MDLDATELYSHSSSATEFYMSPPSATRKDIWGPIRLSREARFDDDLACLEWCMNTGLVFSRLECRKHRSARVMRQRQDRRPSWYCSKCNDYKPIMAHSIFEGSQLPIQKVLMLAYSFARDCDYEDTRANCVMGADDTHLGDHTINDWFSAFREFITADWTQLTMQGPKIGGDRMVAQVDEALIGRRKYNRGRMVEGTWVIGLIDEAGNVRMEVVERRDKNTLAEVIQRNCAIGSEIHTDGWKGYDSDLIGWMSMTHKVVNHSKEFVAADGTHTQRIESQWRSLRRTFTPGGIRREDIAERLLEFSWRRKCRLSNLDPFSELLKLLRA